MKKRSIYIIGMLVIGMLVSNAAFSQSSTSSEKGIFSSEKLSDQLKIFPNPSDGRFQLSLEYDGIKKIAAKIFDITGKLVQDISETLVIDESNVSVEVDLKVPRSGIYFLRIEMGKNAFTKKIIIR